MKLFLTIILLFLLLIVVIPIFAVLGLVHRARRNGPSPHKEYDSAFQPEGNEDWEESRKMSAEERLMNKRFDKSKAEDVAFEEVKETKEE